MKAAKGLEPERRELAPGYTIPRIVQGCWQLSAGHGSRTPDERRLFDRLVARVERGYDTFDVADIYTGAEALLGRLRKRVRRDLGSGARFQVHTKLVPDLSDLDVLRRVDVEAIVDRSLRRLDAERLDLVQLHWWDLSVERWVEVAGWLVDLVAAGKIRHLGVTNFDAESAGEILAAGVPIRSHQVQYSLLDRRPDPGLVALCRHHGQWLLGYGALAGGFLGERWLGAPEPAELPNRSLVKYRLILDEVGGWPALQRLLASLREVGLRRSLSIASIAVRWLLEQPRVAAAIVGVGDGSRSLAELEACGLEGEERELLEAALPPSPPGAVYELERDREGPHGRIMKYDLQRATGDPVARERTTG